MTDETPTTETPIDETPIDTPTEGVDQADTPEGVQSTDTPDEPDTFPRAYVEKLRKEAADNRAKAKHTEALQRELFTLRVAALDKLHSADDMPFDENLLGDPEALAKAVDDLLKAKPYLARQKVAGNVLQGATPVAPKVSLIDMLRG